MILNHDLLKAAALNPAQNTCQRYLPELLEDIKKGKITLPLYQRDMSWPLKKAVDLFNYQLLSKSPISAISFNDIDESATHCVPQVKFISRERLQTVPSGTRSVVDGQQRLTTNLKAFLNHEDFKDIYLDLTKGEFVIVKGKPKKCQIPVGVIYNEDEEVLKNYIKENQFEFEVGTALMQIRGKFKTYSYTVNFATDLTEEEQIHWFEVLNNAGSRVTDVQLKLSRMKVRDVDIYSDYVKAYEKMIKDAGYYQLFKKTSTKVSAPIAALNPAYEIIMNQKHVNNFAPFSSDAKGKKIQELTPEKLDAMFEMTISGLSRALSFIDEHDLPKPSRIDYINYLAGYFVFNPRVSTRSNEKDLIDWYRTVDFKKTNSERRQIFTDLLSL